MIIEKTIFKVFHSSWQWNQSSACNGILLAKLVEVHEETLLPTFIIFGLVVKIFNIKCWRTNDRWRTLWDHNRSPWPIVSCELKHLRTIPILLSIFFTIRPGGSVCSHTNFFHTDVVFLNGTYENEPKNVHLNFQ